MAAGIKITGVRELVKNFDAAEKDLFGLARTAVHNIATTVTKRAKKNAPKDIEHHGPPGRLKRAIKTKRRKGRKGTLRSDTIVNYGQSRNDPKGAWFWFLIEYGSRIHQAIPFIGRALRATDPEAAKIFREAVVKTAIKRMERRNKSK